MVIRLPIVKIQFCKCYEEFSEGVVLDLFQHLFGEGSTQLLVPLRDHWTLEHVQGDKAEICDNAHSVMKPNWKTPRVSDSPSSFNRFHWGNHGLGIEKAVQLPFSKEFFLLQHLANRLPTFVSFSGDAGRFIIPGSWS